MAISFDRLHQVEPSPEARRLLWHALSVGVVARDEAERREAHDKPGAYLFWVSSGKGTLEVGERSFHLQPGLRCWLLDLRQPRDYLPAPGRKLITNGLRLAGPGVEAWLALLGTSSEFVFTQPGDLASIRRAQRHIIELVTRRPRAFEWRVHMLITQILGLLLDVRRVLSEPTKPVPPAVARVVRAVCANPARNWQARELAKVAGVSYSGLRARFKQAEGETLKGFLQRTRLEQVRLLLGDPRLRIKDVAGQLNFSSEGELIRFFHRSTGVSPGQYRLQRKA
jgi:AraC-like DNA-binding protein